MWKSKKKIKQNKASLPRGAVGKGPFAECFWQLRSATLGKIFPARVFPALPRVVARSPRQRIFLKIYKNIFADGFCPGHSAQDYFQKK
jgi:hypothetical protein